MSEAEPEEKKTLASLRRVWDELWARSKKALSWLWRNGWLVTTPLLLAAIVLIWRWPGLHVPLVDEAHPHTLYLLSAIAQSLAAVLALVFTITLVIAQLSSRYSHRMLASFFDMPTILYILLFIVAVLLPFWLLAEPSALGVKLSLTLAVASLLLLVPYFLRFREKLNPEHILLALYLKALKQLRANADKEPEAVATIDNFAMSAFVLKDYDTFDNAVTVLAKLGMAAAQSQTNRTVEKVWRSILSRLRSAGLVLIEDPRAANRMLHILDDIGVEAVRRQHQPLLEQVNQYISDVGMKALDKGLEDAASNAIHYLGKEGARNTERSQEMIKTSWPLIKSLNRLAAKAIGLRLDEIAEQASFYIEVIGTKAGEVAIARGKAADWAQELEYLLLFTADAIGQISSEAADKNLIRFVSRAPVYLGGIGVKAVECGLPNAAQRVALWLWMLGALATVKRNPNITTLVISKLRNMEFMSKLRDLEQSPQTSLVYSALIKAEAVISSSHPELAQALREFADSYRTDEK